MTAAVAAGFAFAGCQREQPTWTKNEYVVFDDGCGTSYTMHGGEEMTVYYGYDPEKVLQFTTTYYDADTGKVSRAYDDYDPRPCGRPIVYTYSANPRNNGLNTQDCYLTIIISAQAVSAQINEHGLTAFDWITEGVGADYSFIPEMTGKYTVTCELREESDEVEFDISDVNGVVVGKDEILNSGWKYYVHVRVKLHGGTKVGVTTSVAFTPDVVNLGDNDIILGKNNVFEFTPEESGIYSVTDTEGEAFGYAILDGETYELITDSPWECEAPLVANKKYFFDRQTGFKNPTEATLTVKFADNPLPPNEETECIWNKYYAITVPEKCNYTLNVGLQKKYSDAVAQLTVYNEQGREELEYAFRDSCERSLLLDAGKHYVRVDENSKITCEPTPVTWQRSQRLESGERSVFIAPFNCKYDFEAERTGAEVKVLDNDGESVADKKLIAGEEYNVYTEFEATYENGYASSDRVSAVPHTAGEFIQNQTVQNVVDGEPYLFSPERLGRYKFTGAAELKVYSGLEPCETHGDTVEVKNSGKFYVVLVADELTYGKCVTARYYPPEIPTDGVTQIKASGARRFDLPFNDEVTINLKHKGTLNYKLYDGDLNEIQTGEFVSQSEAVSQITLSLTAGTYYLSCSNSVTAWFDEPPLGCGGVYTIEKDNKYYGSNTEYGYRFVSGFGVKQFKVTIEDCYALINYCPLKDIIKVYYYDDGTESSLAVKDLSYNRLYNDITITFQTLSEVGEYFIIFMPEHGNHRFYVNGVTPA